MKRTSEGEWNKRIHTLLGAMAWTLEEGTRKLGFKDIRSLRRIRKGGRPSVKFLLQLNKLEKVYEREIAEFKYRHYPYKLYARKRSEGTLHPHIYRPDDLAALGQVGSISPNERGQRRRKASRTRSLAKWNAKKRNKTKARQKSRSRQSYVEWKRQRTFEYKLKRLAAKLENDTKKEQKKDGTGC